MWGEAWASLAEKVFSFVTDEQGLAEFKKRRAVSKLQKEIKDAVACKNYALASSKLSELQRMSDAP